MKASKRFAIAGASGLIGRALVAYARENGCEIVAIGREKRADEPGLTWQTWEDFDLSGCDVVVNVAGASVYGRWDEAKRREILESRVLASRRLVDRIKEMPDAARPRVFLQASGVGFGGDTGENLVREDGPSGDDFLARVCVEWEREGLRATEAGVRTVLLRKPLVLAKQGLAFRQMRLVFSLGLGGKLASGRQWMPWVHISDVVLAYAFAAEHEGLRGPIHVCAPELVRNEEFTKIFACALHRPAWFGVPRFAMRAVLGEFSEVVLASQRVHPDALNEAGFSFRYPNLVAAMQELLG